MSKKINRDKNQNLSKDQSDQQGSHRLQSSTLEFEALTSLSMLVDHVDGVTTGQNKVAKALEASKTLVHEEANSKAQDSFVVQQKKQQQADSDQALQSTSNLGAIGAGAVVIGSAIAEEGQAFSELSGASGTGVLDTGVSDADGSDTDSTLAGVADADSVIVADENEALATNILNSQHESTSKNPHQRASMAAQNVLNKVDLGHVSGSSEDHLLHHASGKTFELSEIFPDIKRLSALEQDRLNQDFLSGFEGTLSQLLNCRRLERMGGSEFGSLPLNTIELIVKQYLEELGLQNRESVAKLRQLFLDIPEKDALVDQLKQIPEADELPNFDPNHPVSLLRYDKDFLAESGIEGLIEMQDEVCALYMKHEADITAAIKQYKFDPTSTEYQELVFYSYILASRSLKRAHFEFYESLVQLQNQYLLFKICAGSFLRQADFELLYELNPKLERLSVYSNPYKVTDACMSHFIYLYDPLVYCLECDAPNYLEFVDNLSRIAYQDTKQKYFSAGLPFNFAFVPPLRSYFSGLIVKFITKESLGVINNLDQDSERRPMMYYDIFFGQDNTSEQMMRRIPEFEKAMQEVGDKLKTAIKNNEITPAMQEWGSHIKHQQDIFKTLDLLGTDNFLIFSDPYLGHCSEIYHQYYYQQLAFYSKYSINLKRKEQFIEQTASRLINLLKQGHYIEALSGEFTKDACREFQQMLAKRRGLFANVGQAEATSEVGASLSSLDTRVLDTGMENAAQDAPVILSSEVPLSDHSALEQATAFIGLSTLEILRDGSTRQHHAQLLPAELEILEHLRLTKGEFKTLKNLIREGVRQLSFEHLPPMVSMNLERGQFIGDNGMIPVIPGTSAHSAFLIGRALHYGDFGLRNQQMARCALLYADLLGHYLATLFVVNLYGVLFDSTFNMQGKQYVAYLTRAVFAANLTAYSDEYLYAPQYFDVQMMLHPSEFYTDEELSEREEAKQEIERKLENYLHMAEKELGNDDSPEDKLKLRDFLAFINDDAQSLVDHSLCSGFNHQSRQLHRILTVVKNKVAVYLSPEYGKTYYQSLADLSKEYLNLFKQLNPTFDLKRSDEGVPCYAVNQFPVILSNALIYLVDLIGTNDRTLASYNNVLHALLHQLYAVMGRTQAPSGSLALYSFLSSLFLVNSAQDDTSLQYYFNMERLSKILYVQLLSSVGSANEFSNSCSELQDFSVVANMFLQLGMCISDLREQGYNLLDRNLANNMGNFTPSQAPYLDEFYKTSAALHNGNSLSYLTAVNHQMDNHEQAELFALLGNLSHSLKTYRDVVRYCIKYDLHELRLAVAQNMVLMRQPYAYYEMYLCCKDLPDRQMEAHTYLYFAALMSVAEAKQDLKELQDSQKFRPLPFLVYFLYLQEQAKTNLSALLCMMMLTVDNSVVPSCFSEYVKMLDLYQGTFSNAQLKLILLKYGVLNKANMSPFMSFSSFYSMFPDTEYEANNSIVEAMNGNFAELNGNLSELDFRYLSVGGQLDLEMCDAQVRVLLTKMFEKLSQGKSLLENLIAASWSHSQSFPPFLKDQFKDYIDAPFVISSSVEVSVIEVINNWLSNSLDPYNDMVDRAWCLALPYDRTRRKEIESLCETLWLNNNVTPSRNLMLAAALVSMRSVVGRPYPRLFRALCRYLANSGQVDARRYVQMDWDFMGIAPYGDIFEHKIGRQRRQLICKMSRRQCGKTLLQVQDIALQEQYSQYIKQHKSASDIKSTSEFKDPLTMQEQGGGDKQHRNSSGSSSSSGKSQDKGEQIYHQDADGLFGQVNLELNDNFDASKQGRMRRGSDASVNLNESQSIKLDPEHSLPTESLLQNSSTVSLGDPGTWISAELYGTNELLNYTYFMMLHSHCGMLAGLLCIKNGWILGRKANSPMRSYSSYLARSLLKNETGAFHRYLYYVQSHYFRYQLNSNFKGEDNKTSTARKFVNEVLQLNINSPKFQQFLEGMRNEGVFDFDGLVDSARNGYVQGSYKFCIDPESEMDTVGGWRNMFFYEQVEYNLTVDEAVAARESLKFLAAKIDRLSDMSLGSNLDEATINRLKYGASADVDASGTSTLDESAQLQDPESKKDVVGVVGLGDEFSKNNSGYGEAKIRMKYGSIAVTKELLKDPVLTKFLGQEVSRIKDATLSKQWINYTFYQEPYIKDRRDLLQMLPYTNSILEQCICANVGQGLMSASSSHLGSGTPVHGISYEPRLVQWRSSKLRISQEESYDPHKVSPDLLLQSLEHTYDNALYQINRTRFHMLRQAQVEPSSVNTTIEAQANWATMLSKQADLRSHGTELFGDEQTKGESSWQNTLITEDGYDALLEKRLLQACFNHTKIADETFYVSEQNYYKELLHKVASAVKNNPQLLKRSGVLGVLLENTNPKQKHLLDTGRVLRNLKDGDLDSVLRMVEKAQEHSQISATTQSPSAQLATAQNSGAAGTQQDEVSNTLTASGATSLADVLKTVSSAAASGTAGGAGAGFKSAAMDDDPLAKEAAEDAKTLDAFSKFIAASHIGDAYAFNEEHHHDKSPRDEVINETRSNEANLLNHLQLFLSDKMGVVPQFEGVVNAEKTPLVRDELDQPSSVLATCFKNVWHFDESFEQQYTRPKMFHEDDNPLHAFIYSIVQAYVYAEPFDRQVHFSITLMNRLFNVYEYFYGACDVVDSSFAHVLLECYMRRYYRCTVEKNRQQRVNERVREFLSEHTDNPYIQDILLGCEIDFNHIPQDLLEHLEFDEEEGTIEEQLQNCFAKQYRRDVFADPHSLVLALTTREQVKHYHQKLLRDDSFISQAMFNFLKDPELMEYSKAVNGDTCNSIFYHAHRNLEQCMRRKLKIPCAPLPLLYSSLCVDYSQIKVNEEHNGLVRRTPWQSNELEYMMYSSVDGVDNLETCERVDLHYLTEFEQQMQQHLSEGETDPVAYSASGKEGVSEFGDNFCPKMPLRIFEHSKEQDELQLLPVGFELGDDADEQEAMAMLQGLSEQILEVPELSAILAEVVKEQGDGQFSMDMLNIALNRAYEAGYLDLDDMDDDEDDDYIDDDDDEDMEFVGIKFLSDLDDDDGENDDDNQWYIDVSPESISDSDRANHAKTNHGKAKHGKTKHGKAKHGKGNANQGRGNTNHGKAKSNQGKSQQGQFNVNQGKPHQGKPYHGKRRNNRNGGGKQ